MDVDEFTAGNRVAHWRSGRLGVVLPMNSNRPGKMWILFDDGKTQCRWCNAFVLVNARKRTFDVISDETDVNGRKRFHS